MSAFHRALAFHMVNAAPDRKKRKMGRLVLYAFMTFIVLYTIVHLLGGVR